MSNRPLSAAFVATLFALTFSSVRADDAPAADAAAPAATTDNAAPEPTTADVAPADAAPVDAAPAPEAVRAPEKSTTASKKGVRIERAESFVAPANWEFDGYVAGGTDQESKSMFYLNDLVYLNVGTQQGFNTGDRVKFYKRGQRVRDPQSGKMLGYEVRRTASGQVTDHSDGGTCAVRILKANEAVEIGDLVRKDD
jgi:hypothetical protein